MVYSCLDSKKKVHNYNYVSVVNYQTRDHRFFILKYIVFDVSRWDRFKLATYSEASGASGASPYKSLAW